MIALDTNIILYFLVSSQPEHKRVATWFETNDDSLATTYVNVGEVLRLLTHPQVFAKPLPLVQAVELLDDFLVSNDVSILVDEERWWANLPALVKEIPGLKGNEVFDARIALCLKYHGVRRICTLDSDFAKYSFLKMVRI